MVMSTNKAMSLTEKFSKYLPILEQTADGEVFLDLKNPKLYKKIVRYYANQGVNFHNDPTEDYPTVVQLISEDLGRYQ